MFDRDTEKLIRLSPKLEGLDIERLPEMFTDAYARIVTARIALRNADQTGNEDISEVLKTMSKLAETNEALVAVLPERENRIAAAFVGATAHQLCFNARKILGAEYVGAELANQYISNDISSLLLFLIAEATADAAEVSNHIQNRTESPVRGAVIQSLKHLAAGRLLTLTRAVSPPRDGIVAGNIDDIAINALYLKINDGIRMLAQAVLDPNSDLSFEAARSVFREVQTLSIGTKVLLFEDNQTVVAFAGPYHLATLLLSTAKDLGRSALSGVQPPSGISSNKWKASIQRFAWSRPYMWRNHKQAIESGYLEVGTSSVVGFPTGAGKSTLAELKINAAVLNGSTVIFLTPTHALADQTILALRKSFPEVSVQGEIQEERLISSLEDLKDLLLTEPEIFVMTPESCLAQMSLFPEKFSNTGLLVFDECHLLHPDEKGDSRRAIDAMLCLLSVVKTAPQSDLLLLSAMMKNTDELAAWIEELTGRSCLSLSLAWKPTRQLRGSLIYHQKDVEALQDVLRSAFRAKTTKMPPAAARRKLLASPLALFSLHQTWMTNNQRDYALVKLLNEKVLLSANKYWKLTPNAVSVSSSVAASAATAGVKTLVFFQTIKNAVSSARTISKSLEPISLRLNEQESNWFDNAVIELGGEDCLFLSVTDGAVSDAAGVHHGLLLPDERKLIESLYKNPQGLKVLTATSTVAQGMNFPSEFVVIGEDSRFDQATDRREILQAQELLNAAGRAGRAGQNASGIVLVVPGKVIGIDLKKSTIGSHWTALKNIFGQSDQCLEIDDPLTALLDRVHDQIDIEEHLEGYVIGHLASDGDGNSSEEALQSTVKSSFAAFKARQSSSEKWVDERMHAAATYYSKLTPETDDNIIANQISSSVGLSFDLVHCLSSELAKNGPEWDANIPDWRRWFFRWLKAHPGMLEQAIKPSNLEQLFGQRKYKSWSSINQKADNMIPLLMRLVWKWMGGATLKEMESEITENPSKVGKCINARKFVLGIVPDFSYLFGIPLMIYERQQLLQGAPEEAPSAISQLRRCVRSGFNFHELAAIQTNMRTANWTRRQVHQSYSEIKPYLDTPLKGELWETTLERVENAMNKELNARDL